LSNGESAWDEDFIDEEEEGYFEFTDRGWGQFHFDYVYLHFPMKT
jgi:hypothetical protein